MILGNSLEAIVEACYLGESLTKKTGRANILVNPKDYLDYIIGRTIIINSDIIPIDTIKTLQENKNKIICRVKREDFPYYPYVLRVNFNVRWNGQILECPKTNIPEIELISRITGKDGKLVYQSNAYPANIKFVDQDFFNLFPYYTFVEGSSDGFDKSNNAIILFD